MKQLNTGEVFLVSPQTSSLQFRAQQPVGPRNGRIVSPAEFNRQQPTPFFPPSSLSQQQTLFAQQQQFPLADPNNQYGPPPTVVPLPPTTEIETETETETDEATTEDTSSDGPVIAIANAGTNGQYYILGTDNTLQRVVYATAQTEDDRLHDGFTAQLRYEPVEPIRDPIYAYNSHGELERIYNKK